MIQAAKVWGGGGRVSSVFFSTPSFRALHKVCHKTQMRAPIRLKCGILKGLIKANLSTKFGRIPMNIHGVMTDIFVK